MKKILLLMMLCTTSIYAKEFPEGLYNTKWKQTRLKDRRNYDVYEFSDRFFTLKQYEDNKLINSSTKIITECRNVKDILIYIHEINVDGIIHTHENVYDINNRATDRDVFAVWYDDEIDPSIYVLRYNPKAKGGVVLFRYHMATKYRKSYIQYFTPLVE